MRLFSCPAAGTPGPSSSLTVAAALSVATRAAIATLLRAVAAVSAALAVASACPLAARSARRARPRRRRLLRSRRHARVLRVLGLFALRLALVVELALEQLLDEVDLLGHLCGGPGSNPRRDAPAGAMASCSVVEGPSCGDRELDSQLQLWLECFFPRRKRLSGHSLE